MRLLIDTNIFIYREDFSTVPSNLQTLLKKLNVLNVMLLLHPLSVEEIKNDSDEKRKQIVLSKINTYPILNLPPNSDTDISFKKIVGNETNSHDKVDNELLYAVYKEAV